MSKIYGKMLNNTEINKVKKFAKKSGKVKPRRNSENQENWQKKLWKIISHVEENSRSKKF